MGAHLYVCESGGPMVVGMDGPPAPWVTCPVCTASECSKCDGAQLQGDAPPFEGGTTAAYRCPAGHEKTFVIPPGRGVPESAQCTECGLMLLLVP
jgi:hypothetical protein